jgi:hypothetical protein
VRPYSEPSDESPAQHLSIDALFPHSALTGSTNLLGRGLMKASTVEYYCRIINMKATLMVEP